MVERTFISLNRSTYRENLMSTDCGKPWFKVRPCVNIRPYMFLSMILSSYIEMERHAPARMFHRQN